MKVEVEKQQGSVSTLQIELPPEEVSKEWDAIANSFARFARIPGYRPGKAPRAVIEKRFRKEIQDELLQETDGRKISWQIGRLPELYGDRSMLKLALLNLISNAVKFTRTRPRPEIEIGCSEKRKDGAVLFIRDNGVGFDMKYVNKLFGVFQRLHRTEEFEGTGIGLATVQRIIHRHGGRVWAESVVDSGATFYLSLPTS